MDQIEFPLEAVEGRDAQANDEADEEEGMGAGGGRGGWEEGGGMRI